NLTIEGIINTFQKYAVNLAIAVVTMRNFNTFYSVPLLILKEPFIIFICISLTYAPPTDLLLIGSGELRFMVKWE
ncbi:hypothetical protein NW132_08725, partial [Staphylococcus pettenkoferi]|uniref:hypothetical protein n=1 Tax=Staphylococcus pettenkoferi TaxID=170573 RepID=UPI0022750AD0